MPRRAVELTPAQIKGLKHKGGKFPDKVAVGGVSGLLLQITPNNAKSWVLRTRFGEWAQTRLSDGTIQSGRKKREIGLGAYPDVLPGAARDKAREIKAKLEAGVDPILEKKTARAALLAAARRGMTFAEAWEKFAAQKEREFSTDKYRRQWRAMVENHAIPELGRMMVQDVSMQDVLRVLQPIWTDKTETAVKLRERIEKVLGWATVHGFRTGENPARWKNNLDMTLPKPGKVAGAENYPSLQLDDVSRWWRDLLSHYGMGAEALKFQALTATRTGAVRFATWDEVNLKERLWTIQPGRQSSKIQREDTAKKIPLTDDMVRLLEGLPRLAGSNYVFWAASGGALSDATLGKLMRTIHEADVKAGRTGYVDVKTGAQAVPHGLRATFRTWIADRTNYDGDLAEVALLHKLGDRQNQAYNRAEQVEKRRAMMAAWGNFIHDREVRKVVNLRSA